MSVKWQVLVPVKRLSQAKSRLELPSASRGELALAMCMDVITAVIGLPAVAAVHVVTRDPKVVAAAGSIGAQSCCVPRVHDLNEELAAATDLIRSSQGVAILVADLPCLTGDLFAQVLDRAPLQRASFVPDLSDEGTSMLLMPPSVRVAPCFGHGSAAAHKVIATGIRGSESWFGARRDVDRIEDLATAAQYGLGPFTTGWEGLASATSLAGGGDVGKWCGS